MRTLDYPALQISKATWPFQMVTFFCEAGDLARWCGVYRKAMFNAGYQRILKPTHYQQIKKFLDQDLNVIPNSVVIAFNDALSFGEQKRPSAVFRATESLHPADAEGAEDSDTTLSVGTLTVNAHEECLASPALGETEDLLSDLRSAFVIDGQHRMAGGNAAAVNVYYPVTAFLGVTMEDQAFHFIVINRQAKKVNKDDMDAVIPQAIYDNLQARLTAAGIHANDADIVYALDNQGFSPFAGLIVWPNNKSEKAVITKGAVDRLIKYARKVPAELAELFEDEAELISAIWQPIRKHLGAIWTDEVFRDEDGNAYENQFIKKNAAMLPAIQMAINSALEHGGIQLDIQSPDPRKRIGQAVEKWIRTLPLELFYCEWNIKSVTNESQMSALQQHITLARRRGKVPYGDEGKGWFSAPVSQEEKLRRKKVAKTTGKRKKRSRRRAPARSARRAAPPRSDA